MKSKKTKSISKLTIFKDMNLNNENLQDIHQTDSDNKVEKKWDYKKEFIRLPDSGYNNIGVGDPLFPLLELEYESLSKPEDIFCELKKELEKQISWLSERIECVVKLKNRVKLLEKVELQFTGDELFALAFCIYGCDSFERSNVGKEDIKKNILHLEEMLNFHKVDPKKLSEKVFALQEDELSELTQILVKSIDIRWFTWDNEVELETFDIEAIKNGFSQNFNSVEDTEEDLEPSKESTEDKGNEEIDLDLKVLGLIKKYPEIRDRIAEFDKENNYYCFAKSFGFHRRRSFLKFEPASKMWSFELECRSNGYINNSDSASDALVVKEILRDYIIREGQRQRNCNAGFHAPNIRFDEKKLQSINKNDNSLINPEEDLKNYYSEIFEKENLDLIKSYYTDYTWIFTVTIEEFERQLFLFLLYITEKSYSLSIDANEILLLKSKLNALLFSKFIDLSDEFTMIFLYIFYSDPELKRIGDEIFEDFKKKLRMVEK